MEQKKVHKGSIRCSAKALVYDNGKLLLNSHRTSAGELYYDLPGGGQNPYETMEEAVVREVLEETGLQVQPLRFAALCEEIFTNESMRERFPEYCHRCMHIFLVKIVPGPVREKTELDFQQTGSAWFTPEEAEVLPIVPIQLRGHIRQALSSDSPIYFPAVRRDEVCM